LAQVRVTCAARLEPVSEAIQGAIARAEVLHVDETGLGIEGQSRWVHVASTDTLTHYSPQVKRGQSATDAIGILPVFQRTVVHDAWPGYFQYPSAHSLCNAHVLRDLKAVSELNRQHWPDQMARLLLTIKAAVERAVQAGHTTLALRRVNQFTARYRQLVQSGLRANPPPTPTGRPGQGPIRSLLLRLKDRASAVLAFMHDFRVPFDNNLAERDLRMVKVRQKISGGFRSWTGTDVFCRIRGYLSTMRKQGHNAFVVLAAIFAGCLISPRLGVCQ
jgi:transposase